MPSPEVDLEFAVAVPADRVRQDGEIRIAQALARHTRKLDPTRPVTSALCMVGGDAKRTWEDTDAIFDALDIGGYNYQFREYRKDHERQPARSSVHRTFSAALRLGFTCRR